MPFEEQQPETFTINRQPTVVEPPLVFEEQPPQSFADAQAEKNLKDLEDKRVVTEKQEKVSKLKEEVESLEGLEEDISSIESIEKLRKEILSLEFIEELSQVDEEQIKKEVIEEVTSQIPDPEQGEVGKEGESGEVGKRGLMGLRGLIGGRGLIGRRGSKGSTGKSGQDGSEGVRGLDGDKGKDGKDADEEKIAKNVIREVLQRIPRNEGFEFGFGTPNNSLATQTIGIFEADVDDLNLGFGSFFRLSSDDTRTISGFENGTSGRSIVLANIGSNDIVLGNQDSGSGGVNRIITGTGEDFALAPNALVTLVYDGEDNRWRVQDPAMTTVTVTSSAHTAAEAHYILVDDDTAGAVTVTLPAVEGRKNIEYHIKKLGSTANVTIDADGIETIDGGETAVISTQFESLMIVCDGKAWFII